MSPINDDYDCILHDIVMNSYDTIQFFIQEIGLCKYNFLNVYQQRSLKCKYVVLADTM